MSRVLPGGGGVGKIPTKAPYTNRSNRLKEGEKKVAGKLSLRTEKRRVKLVVKERSQRTPFPRAVKGKKRTMTFGGKGIDHLRRKGGRGDSAN